METKEPESSEALEPETDTEVMKNNLNSEGSKVAHTNATQDLSLMRFHSIHGKCIKMSNDYCTAEPSCDKFFILSPLEYVVFSSRPVAVDEKVFLCLELVPDILNSTFDLGFTNCDPNTMTSIKLPDLYKSVQLSWDNLNYKVNNIIFHLCVKPSGEVSSGINDTDMGIVFEKINIDVPLWVFIKLTRYVTSLKFIDCLNETDELKPKRVDNPPASTYASAELTKTNQKQDMKGDETKLKPDKKEDLDEKTEENEGSASTVLGTGSGVSSTEDLPPVRFHRVHGGYIKMSGDNCTARVKMPDFSEIDGDRKFITENKCLVFTSRPIVDGEKVYLRLKTVPKISDHSLIFGLTNCDPNSITDLKSWNNYSWIHHSLENNIYKTNFLSFCIKKSGEGTCCLSDDALNYRFTNFNVSGPLWAVLKLPYYVTNVKFINSLKGTTSERYKLFSEEKPSPPTTNALVAVNNLIGNVSSLKLDSTMAKEKPKSQKTFKPVINIDKIKSHSNAEDDEASLTGCALDVLTPLRFHRVHGGFVTISDDYCSAINARPDTLCSPWRSPYYAFTSRPVSINEKVYLRLEKASSPYIHPFSFGFTDLDPNFLVDLLPKLCSFTTACIVSNCLSNLPFNFGTEGNSFFFFLKPSGEVCYGNNGKEIGSISKVVNVKNPLWGLIKLSNCIPTATFIDYPKENMTEDLKCLSTQKCLQYTKLIADSVENKKTDILKLTTPSSELSPEKPTFYWSGGTPIKTTPYESLRFHSVHGKYIKLSPDKTVANYEVPDIEPLLVTHECYVFSSRPIDVNEKVHLKLEAVSTQFFDSFEFGFTDCDPCIIPNIMDRLCKASPCIFGKYLTKLPCQFCVKDNYMYFYVTKSGEVHFMVNEKYKGIFHGSINISSRIWAVIKVTNSVSSVRLENKKQASFKSFFPGEISSAQKTSSGIEKSGTLSKNTKSEGGDEKKNIPADRNILTGMPRTYVTRKTKRQTLSDWRVESSVKSEPAFKKAELKSEQTVQEALKLNLQPSTSNTPAKLVQPTSSTSIKYIQKPADYDAIHFAKIVEYQLNTVPEDKRMKCMQKILQVLDKSPK